MAEHERTLGKIIAKAWSDPDFKKKLTADPVAVLREHGIDLPPDTEVRVVEDSLSRRTLVIPPAPAEVSDEELDRVAAGGWSSCMACSGCQ